MKLSNEDGLTLTEVLMSAGLLGLLALAIMQGTTMMKKMKARSNQTLAVQSYSSEGLKKLKTSADGVSWERLNFERTYTLVNESGKIDRVDWDFTEIPDLSNMSDIEVEVRDPSGSKIKFTRDSHTLISTKGGKMRVYFSRCVPIGDYEKNITPQMAASYDKVPFVSKKDKVDEIYCCKRGLNKLCSSKIDSPKDKFRIMTFDLRDNSNWKVFPVPSERKYLLGNGFIFFTNRSRRPNAFVAYHFTLTNTCFTDDDRNNCDKRGKVNSTPTTGSISTRSVYDSGQLIIQ